MKYLYYRIYRRLKKVKTNDTPAFNALLLLGLLQGINIATILSLIKFYTKVAISKEKVITIGIAITFLVLIFQFRTLFHRLDLICKQYENETIKERNRGTIYVVSYILVSLIVFILTGEILLK